MRVSELSRRTDVPVATIKYYLREGLLHSGVPTAATQAEYDDDHVQRLRLIRALADPGGLSLTGIRGVLAAVDDEGTDVHTLLGVACYALGPRTDGSLAGDPEHEKVRADVDAFLAELGWDVTESAPAREQLTYALLALRRVGMSYTREHLRSYADAVQSLARDEVRQLNASETRTEAVETAVIAIVLYEPVLLALRRLAQEHESARRYRA